MLFVKTYLDKSPIHGIGVFASQFIPKGTVIWQFVQKFDFSLTKKQLDKLPDVSKSWVLHFCYRGEKGEYNICVDDARFFNHSEHPNTDNTTVEGTVAKRDIHKGEEITCNYNEFDKDTTLKLVKKK